MKKNKVLHDTITLFIIAGLLISLFPQPAWARSAHSQTNREDYGQPVNTVSNFQTELSHLSDLSSEILSLIHI